MTTEQFKIKPNGFREIRRIVLIRTIPLTLLALGAGFAVTYSILIASGLYLIVIPMSFAAAGLGLYSGIKRQKQIYDSYTLTIDSNGITREQFNTQTISMSYTEITAISKSSNGSFTIKGRSALNAISVPAQIDNYSKLEQLLNDIKPIFESNIESVFQKYGGLLGVLNLGLMVTVFLSDNKVIVAVCGILLLILMGYGIFVIQSSRNIDEKTKRASLFGFLVILLILVVLFYKLVS